MPCDEAVFVDQADLVDGRHDHQLSMGVGDRDGVGVSIEPHERLRTGRAVRDPSRLEGLLRQRQKRLPVEDEEFFLRAVSPAGPSLQIGQTVFAKRGVQRFERLDLRNGTRKSLRAQPSRRSTCPFSLNR